MFVDYYGNLLGKKATERVQDFSSIIKENGNSLSEAQQQEITQPFMEREVKQAIFQIDRLTVTKVLALMVLEVDFTKQPGQLWEETSLQQF